MHQQTLVRRTSLWIVAAAALLCVAPGRAATTLNSGRQITLSEQLTLGLQVATKSDEKFVARVVALVHGGTLPRKLVDSTFLWARQAAARRGGAAAIRPMIYFRPALVLRAKRLGIKL